MPEDNRKEPRNTIEDGVLYLHESGGISKAAQHGLAFDISNSGACIYSQQSFAEGDYVKIFCSNFGDTPIKATVRWCKKMDDRLFKVGLSFNGSADRQ